MSRHLGLLLAAAAIMALLALLYTALARRPGGEGPAGANGVNSVGGAVTVRPRPAPDFRLNVASGLLGGQLFRLSEQRGKVVVVNFWASWCPPCRDEAAALERGWQAYRQRDVVVVGVNVWDRAPAMQQFLEKAAITYPNGPEATGEAAIAYGVRGLPETFFVDRSGQIVRKWIGPLTARQLAATLDELGP